MSDAKFVIKSYSFIERRYTFRLREPYDYWIIIHKGIRLHLYKKWYMRPFSKWWIQYKTRIESIPMPPTGIMPNCYSSSNLFDYKWWKDTGFEHVKKEVVNSLESKRDGRMPGWIPDRWKPWDKRKRLNSKLKKVKYYSF